MSRSILHIDMDAFFAAVEQRDNPKLKGKPVIVGAPPDKRGVVATCSYEARKFGVHSAMPSGEAFKRCPEAVFVCPDMRRYKQASAKVFAIFDRFTPYIEPLSIDEAFLDVSGVLRLHGSACEIAEKIRCQIRDEVGLNASVGIACNKFLAKLGSKKAKPDGMFEMPADEDDIVAFLGTLDISDLWGVGSISRKILTAAGYLRISDIQECNQDELAGIVGGRFADQLVNLSFGRDSRPVEAAAPEKSISREYTFNEDVRDRETLKNRLLDLCDEVGDRLRVQGYYATVCRIKIRWAGFRTITRQRQFPAAVCDDFSIREQALDLFAHESLVAPVRLIGMGVSGLVRTNQEQLLLFDECVQQRKRREKLSRTVDIIRRQLGRDLIKRGSSTKTM
ncbi:MAG: DNA polymerase IV [Kiritimatiellia bacterium]